VEELNKELRQCNLQQFIQQAGALPTHTQSRTDLNEHPEELDLTQQQQDKHNGMARTHYGAGYTTAFSTENRSLLIRSGHSFT